MLSSLSAQCVSVVIATLLPAVGVSMYFYSNDNNDFKSVDMKMSTDNSDVNAVEKSSVGSLKNGKTPRFSFSLAIQRIGEHLKMSYSNMEVVQWSILWGMAMCGFLQVCNINELVCHLLFNFHIK